MRAACWLAALLSSSGFAGEHPTIVVMAAPPLDPERLADALRSYLDSYAVEVRAMTAPPQSDLRAQLAATDAAGSAVRAVAAIRVAGRSPSEIEIQLIDRISGKAVIASLPRLQRDEDFYRTVALKMQALLRASLYEEVDKLQVAAPRLAQLVAAPRAPPHRLSLEAAYALVSFPLGEVVQHGVAVTGRFEIGRLVELSLAVEVLAPISAVKGDVSALIYIVPITLGAGVHLRRPRLEGAIGAVGELLVVALDAESASARVRSDRFVAPALGIQLAGRLRLTQTLWLYLRASALGVLTAERYTIRGQTVLDVARLQVGGEAGLGVALW